VRRVSGGLVVGELGASGRAGWASQWRLERGLEVQVRWAGKRGYGVVEVRDWTGLGERQVAAWRAR
jgi:hypothetical protein